VICAKFVKDLFNISKVIGRKKSGPVFLDSQCINRYNNKHTTTKSVYCRCTVPEH